MLVCFYHGTVVPIGIITDGVLLPNPSEGEDIENLALVKSHCPEAF